MSRFRSSSPFAVATAPLAVVLAFLTPACAPTTDEESDFAISFELDTAPNSDGLQEIDFTVIYTGGGAFVGSSANVECAFAPMAERIKEAVATHDETNEQLEVDLSLTAAAAPIEEGESIVSCTYRSKVTPASGNFAIRIESAVNENGEIVADANDTIDLTMIIGDRSSVPTASSSSTTTTIATGATEYEITVDIEADVMIGAIQLDLTHLGGSGDFVGSGQSVDCSSFVSGGLFTANNPPGRAVRLGLISLEGIPAGPFARCAFLTRESLTATDFGIVVVDASTPELMPIVPLPTARVSVEPR